MTILIVAPHADDEVLGMGGVISRFTSEGKSVVLAVLTGYGEEPHPIWPENYWLKIREECQNAAKIIGVDDIRFFDLPAACLDTTPAWKINKVVTQLISDVNPSSIYIPFEFDLHKDHGAIAYAVNVATRPYLPTARNVVRVLAYETLSETHLAPPYLAPAFQPNVFIDISLHLEQKLRAMTAYQSQLQPEGFPRSLTNIDALARLRGSHIGVRAAEAFVLLGEYLR